MSTIKHRASKKYLAAAVSLLAVCFCLFTSSSASATVTARLDRNRISIDETVHLVVEAEGALNAISSLDTTPLEKDFKIVNQSTSSNFEMINGKSRTSKTWTLELEPRRTGQLTIPPLKVRGEKTAALKLTVTAESPPPPVGAADQRKVFIEVTPEMDTPAYLQSQITISVKLFIRSNQRISDAGLEEPKIDHANIIKLGDDVRYTTHRGETTYQVIERKYAIIPEEGQKITVPSLHFQAIIGGSFFANDPFFDRFSGRARRIRAHSPELEIPLLPIPDDYTGKTWLPARKLSLQERQEKQGKESVLKVGEPLTRVIQIEALGLSAEQLPDIECQAPDGGKIYSDKPELKTYVDGNFLHAVKRQSIAFIPSRPGTFTLPEIRIKWWDVVHDRQAEAVLPARTVKVVGSAPTPTGGSTAALSGGTSPTATVEPTERGKSSGPTPRPQSDELRLWQGLSALFFALWVLTLFFWWKARRQASSSFTRLKAGKGAPEQTLRADLQMIKKACLAGDPRKTHQALLDWGKARWPDRPPTSIGAIARRLGQAELEKLFPELEKALYSPAGGEWNGPDFWQRLSPLLKAAAQNPRQKKGDGRLPPLYPERDRN